MSPLLLNEACLMLIVAGEFVSTSLQVVHLFLVAFQTDAKLRHLSCALETAVLIHLALALVLTVGAGLIGAPVLAWALASFRGFGVLWINAASAILAFAMAIYHRRPDYAVDALFMALCTPPVITGLGVHWNLVALLDIAWLLFRGLAGISRDLVRRSEGLSDLSIAETLMSMPAGLLVVGATGGSTFMNDQMRYALSALGLPCDLGDQSALWQKLSARGRDLTGEAASLNIPNNLANSENRLLVDLPDATTWLFTRDVVRGRRRRERIICIDATETVRANDALSATNRELERAADELRSRLADVDRAAETSAYLRMRSRVHDVVGQRLSILHRYLEMERTDPASVTELERLLSSVMNDLQRDSNVSAQAELDAVVDAFALVGVEVEVRGELPPGEVGVAFAKIIREACTNSCRHAHAKHVFVELEQVSCTGDDKAGAPTATGSAADATVSSPGGAGGHEAPSTTSVSLARLTITDDGKATEAHNAPLVERGGITGMRRGIGCLGGRLSVMREPRFTICAEVPISVKRENERISADPRTDAFANATKPGAARDAEINDTAARTQAAHEDGGQR